jgi:nitric oxide reductase activation protein
VALQGYILSAALSRAGIPHRVLGYCTFWDYTVLRRFREYDEGKDADRKILEFTSSSNNRDGLALRAAADGLLRRHEENKVLIMLSDGRPNDLVIRRPDMKNKQLYTGEYAVKDTASEVRRLRSQGISVMGVFAGEEKDLQAERRIFGKDFAYIRDISTFAHVVGRYLKKLVDSRE